MAGERTLPVIDVSPVLGGDLDDVAAQLDEAYVDVGFCYVTGHGIAPELVTDLFAASRAFHGLTLEDKREIALNEWHRGFMEINSSLITTSTVDTVRQPNQSESLMVMHDLPADHPDVLGGVALAGPNQWPEALPDLPDRVLAFDSAMRRLCQQLVPAIAVALGQPASAFDEYFTNPITFLRLLRYPPHPSDAPENLFGSAPHSDYGFITLLAQEGLGGLQVRAPDATWIDAPPLEGAFVMNCADILHRWSNGRWLSTPHRVINDNIEDRYSAPYFFDPHGSAVIAPLATCIEPGEIPAFEPVRYEDYLMSRLQKNYARYGADTSGQT